MQSALWAPIVHTEACRQHQIPLKRGVLLEGTYGTGKTLLARRTAQVCVKHGWTFIMLDDVRALREALVFARRYEPAVVFAEDVDRLVGDRDQAANDLLNTIDGVLSKDSSIITVLTTNHVEKINKAMLRPGRLDAVISIKPPKADAVIALIRMYGRDLLAQGETLVEAGKVLAGNIPATIREVVERAKLSMIFHGRAAITQEDILTASYGMADHMALLADKPAETGVGERLVSALGDALKASNGLDIMEKRVENIDRNLEEFARGDRDEVRALRE